MYTLTNSNGKKKILLDSSQKQVLYLRAGETYLEEKPANWKIGLKNYSLYSIER